MSAAKTTSEEAVVNALASGGELTNAEITTATGLGRSTVGKALAALERDGIAGRRPGGRDGRRRRPDRWSVGTADEDDTPARRSTQRLRPGQLDGLVLDYINSQGKDAAVGATAVARTLGRSAGAVGNCLTRLAAAGQLRQVSEKPRRYSTATSASRTHGGTRRPRTEPS